MPADLTYRPVEPNEPIGPIARLPSFAFGVELEKSAEWFEQMVGRENVRVSCLGDEIVGCVGRVPMGIYLCGNEVPQLGVLGVAVSPEARGGGVATRMMADCVREMHADGYALSALYSAMHALYRGVGYEDAGLLCEASIPAGMIETADRGSGWREATKDDLPAIEACYAEHARHNHGMLARCGYLWKRIRESKFGPTRWFIVDDGRGGAEAYCFYVQEKWDSNETTLGTAAGSLLRVTDLAWTTPRGFEHLRGFLRGFASMVGEIRVALPPASPLLMTLPDRRYSFAVREPWMLRVLDVPGALGGRGYLPGLTCRLVLELEDRLIEANNGRWTLAIEDGSPAVSRGGEGESLRCNIRDLAPIFTGYVSAASLRGIGRAECSDRVAAVSDAVFSAGQPPAMVEMF